MTPQDGNRSNLSDPTPACSRRVVRCVTEPSLGNGCNGTVMDQWDPKRWHFTGHFHLSMYWEHRHFPTVRWFFPGPGVYPLSTFDFGSLHNPQKKVTSRRIARSIGSIYGIFLPTFSKKQWPKCKYLIGLSLYLVVFFRGFGGRESLEKRIHSMERSSPWGFLKWFACMNPIH